MLRDTSLFVFPARVRLDVRVNQPFILRERPYEHIVVWLYVHFISAGEERGRHLVIVLASLESPFADALLPSAQIPEAEALLGQFPCPFLLDFLVEVVTDKVGGRNTA